MQRWEHRTCQDCGEQDDPDGTVLAPCQECGYLLCDRDRQRHDERHEYDDDLLKRRYPEGWLFDQ